MADETNSNLNYRRTARILTIACGLLFSIFSIAYLAVFQDKVLEALHYSLSLGRTHYSPWVGAVLVTLVLLLLRWGVNALLRLQGWVSALSYFPSCLLLGVLTDVGRTVYQGGGITPFWAWLLPLLLLVYGGVGYVLGRVLRFPPASTSVGAFVNVNLLTLLVLVLMSVSIGNSNIHFHYELDVEHALREDRYADARKVGEKMLDPSRTLTALRAYAMSREGSMGEYLFAYPQRYGAEGLLLGTAEGDALRLTTDSLYAYLGATPRQGEKALDFFRRICREETGNYTTLDYYLSALLLEKRLDEFVTEFDKLYTVTDFIPLYYREALFLYERLHPSGVVKVGDEAMSARWLEYENLQQELAGTIGEGNRMRRKYGDTYWWYYQYH